MRLLFTVALISAGATLSYAEVADIRVLIDVSGSMKQNDPRNLRRPALDLLLHSIPDKNRAGVWTFGRQVNMLVPHSEVDDQWRKVVAEKSRFINSVALRTNIGGALETAAYDIDPQKFPESSKFERAIILLTDGVVDISPDESVNELERERLLNDVLPLIQDAGIKIHTIALSSLADADLLEQLANETGGSFTVADEADDLSKSFISALDLSAPGEQIPLDDNMFQVDSSVEEFSAVIFRNASAPETEFIAPSGERYTESNILDGVRWVSSENYDLVTINSPEVGRWQVGAESDPDNRVTIVSNLAVKVEAIDQQIYPEEQTPLSVTLSQNSETVIDNRFLELVDVHAVIEGIGDDNFALPEYKEELLRDLSTSGQYTTLMSHPQTPGRYRLSILVDGKTFKRQKRYEFTVSPSFNLSVSKRLNDSSEIIATTNNLAWQGGDVRLQAEINNQYGDSVATFPLSRTAANEWAANFEAAEDGNMTLSVTAFRGNQKLPLSPVVFQGTNQYTLSKSSYPEPAPTDSIDALPELAPMIVDSVEETEVQNEPIVDSEATPDSTVVAFEDNATENEAEVEQPNNESGIFSNWLVIVGLVAGNLLLIAGLYVVYRKLTAEPALAEDDEDLEFEEDAPVEQQATPVEQATEPNEEAVSDSDIPESEPVTEAAVEPQAESQAEPVQAEEEIADDSVEIEIPEIDTNEAPAEPSSKEQEQKEPTGTAETQAQAQPANMDDIDGLLDELNNNLDAELDALAKENEELTATKESPAEVEQAASDDGISIDFDNDFDLSSDMSEALEGTSEETKKEEGR